MNYPDFFHNRTEPWSFEDVLHFIKTYFEAPDPFEFRVGTKTNTIQENQRAGLVFVYAKLMNYSFPQIKALFSEHDHFAISIPKSREGRNILAFNNLYIELLKNGYSENVRIDDVPEYFSIPDSILVLKN